MLTQIRDRIVATGQLSPEQMDAPIARFDDPSFNWMGPVVVSAWGRRPTQNAREALT
jgi:hypothetical protein